MTENRNHEYPISQFYLPLKNDVKHFSSIIGILDKLELDKNLENLGFSFTNIFDSEINYALSGIFKRTQKIKEFYSNAKSARTTSHQQQNFQR